MDLDVASKFVGDVMGVLNFKTLVFAAISLGVLTSSAFAAASDSYRYGACRQQADEIANSYMASYLEPATDAQRAPKGSYVFIGAGSKFIVPLRPANNGDYHLRGTGQLIHWRAGVYQEELARCLGIVHLQVVGDTSISGQLN